MLNQFYIWTLERLATWTCGSKWSGVCLHEQSLSESQNFFLEGIISAVQLLLLSSSSCTVGLQSALHFQED